MRRTGFSLLGGFKNRSFVFKVLSVLVLTLLIYSAASDIFFYFSMRYIITKNVQVELKNTNSATVNMIRASIDASIHNYLRAVAEKDLDVVNGFYQDYKAGKISEEEAKARATRALLSQKIGTSGYIFAVDTHGIMQVHPKPEMVGTNRTGEEIFGKQQQMKTGYMEYNWKNPGETVERPKAMYMAYFEPWDWIISASSYREEFLSLVNLSDFRDRILSIRFGNSGYASVIDSKGNLIIHPNQEGSNIYNQRDNQGRYFVQEIIRTKTGQTNYDWLDAGSKTTRQKLAVFDYIPERDWYVLSTVYLDEIYEPLYRGTFQFALVNTGMSLLILVIVGFIVRWVARPINYLAGVANKIAEGDLDQEIVVGAADETGKLASAFQHMIYQLRQMLQAEQDQRRNLEDTVQRYVHHMAEVSRGNLSNCIEMSHAKGKEQDPLVVLGLQLNETTVSLRQMIQQIRDAATRLSSASAEILAATTQQASGASEQSAAIAQTTTTVDEVKAIATHSSERASEMTDAAQRTVEVSQGGQKAVQSTIESMNAIRDNVSGIAENILALSEQTQQIGEIIASVNSIASQSNMLALNASVEAARAGEHGKGFAVVAQEVRALAEQSRQATAQVKGILSEIQKATNATVMSTEEGAKGVDKGVQLAAQAQRSIMDLSTVILQTSQTAKQMAMGGQQQVAGIEQVAVAMQNINMATMQSLASTRQAEKAAQNLADLAHNLAKLVDQYRV